MNWGICSLGRSTESGMMRIFSFFLMACLGTLVLGLGCGGESAVRPTPVASVITPIAPTPMVVPFYTGSGDRLVLDHVVGEGLEEEGSGTEDGASGMDDSGVGGVGSDEVARPTPFLKFEPVAGGGEGGDPPVSPVGVESWEVDFTDEELGRALALRSPSCTDYFRVLLVNYDGVESFGPEVAQRLSDRMIAGRPDCLVEGWSPIFAMVQTCRGVRVTGEPESGVPNNFRVRLFGGNVLGPTKKDGALGYMLLHFIKLPLSDKPGCWFYRPDVRTWFWSELVPLYEDRTATADDYVRGDSGTDSAVFHQCDSLLGILIPKMLAAGDELDALMVAVAIDRVRLLVPEHCSGVDPFGRYFWDIYPQGFPQVGCGLNAPTGPVSDGRYVINWAEGYFDAEESPCWVFEPLAANAVEDEQGDGVDSGEASAEGVSPGMDGVEPGELAPDEGGVDDGEVVGDSGGGVSGPGLVGPDGGDGQ